MKEILQLMEQRKQENMDTLQWLQKQPRVAIRELVNEQTACDEKTNDDENVDNDNNGVRASARLAAKRKIDYKRMNTQGKDDNWLVGEY